MVKLEYYSDVKDGKLQKNVSQLIANDLKHFESKRVCITISQHKSKRSTQQNRLFHAYIGILAKDLGYDFEEMKDIVKYKYLLMERVNESNGEIYKYLGSTSKLNKSDFADLISNVIRFGAELNIVLPLPENNFTISY